MKTRNNSTWKDVIAKTEDYFGFLSSLSGAVRMKAVAEVHVRLQILIQNLKKERILPTPIEKKDGLDEKGPNAAPELTPESAPTAENKNPARGRKGTKISPGKEATAPQSSPPPQKTAKTRRSKSGKQEPIREKAKAAASTSEKSGSENIKSEGVKTEPKVEDYIPPAVGLGSEEESDNDPGMDTADYIPPGSETTSTTSVEGSPRKSQKKRESISTPTKTETADVKPEESPADTPVAPPVETPSVTPFTARKGRGRPRRKRPSTLSKDGPAPKKAKSVKSEQKASDDDTKPPGVKRVGRPRKEYTQCQLGSLPPVMKTGPLFPCEICGKQLSKEHTLADHMRVHTGDLLQCKKCDKKFLSKNTLYMHMRDHSERKFYRCDRCQYSSLRQDLLEDHIAMKHGPDRPRSICDICGKTFCRPNSLTEHMRTHSKVKYSCDLCDFTTHSPGILRIHNRNKHTEDKETYTCKLCGAILRYKGSYQAHMRSHFGRKPFQCDICGNCFTSQTQRASHKLTHFEASFPCPECGKKFRDKHKVSRHMVIHTGEKTFQCDKCSYRCNLKHNLQKHCKNVHGIVMPYQRPIIEKVMSDGELANVESVTIVPEGEEHASETVYIGRAGQIIPNSRTTSTSKTDGLLNINTTKTTESNIISHQAIPDPLVVMAAPKSEPEGVPLVVTNRDITVTNSDITVSNSDITGFLSAALTQAHSVPALIKLESGATFSVKGQPPALEGSLIPSVVEEVQESSIQHTAVPFAEEFQQPTEPLDISEHMYAMKTTMEGDAIQITELHVQEGTVIADAMGIADGTLIADVTGIGALNNTGLGAMETVSSGITLDVFKPQ